MVNLIGKRSSTEDRGDPFSYGSSCHAAIL
jgi:hypothetical protein